MALNLRSSKKGKLVLKTSPSQSSTPPPPPPALNLKFPLVQQRSSSLSPQVNLLHDQVFTSLPQSPHFNPLANLSESIREGIKHGSDIAFLNLVMKFQDFVDVYTFLSEVECYEKEFMEFEEMGYDLTEIRKRFNQLKGRAEQEMDLKDEIDKLDEEKKHREATVESKELILMELEAKSARVANEIEMEKSMIKRIDNKKRKMMKNSNVYENEFRKLANEFPSFHGNVIFDGDE